jgi:nicotinamide mononucleotide transporter
MHRHTDAALPRWDAFVLVFSLIAQWWQARKRFENWVAWMVVDAMAIGVYWAKDLKMTSYLYSVYFAMAVAGHIAWKKSMGSDGPGRVSTPR